MGGRRITYEHLEKWAGIILDCIHSGLTVEEYCAQHDMDVALYRYWYRLVALEIKALGITD